MQEENVEVYHDQIKIHYSSFIIRRGKFYFIGLIKIVLQAILILSNNLRVRNFLLF